MICSAVFITGLDPEFAAENVGYFTAPYDVRAKLGKPVVDREHKQVRVTVPDGVTRTAVYLGDQGCVSLPVGKDSVSFKPVKLKSTLPNASEQAWPTGDMLPSGPPPRELDMAKVKEAVDAAFASPDAKTAAFVVTWRGRLVAERYAPEITAQTPLESWSMGKSVTATLMGVLIQQGAYELWSLEVRFAPAHLLGGTASISNAGCVTALGIRCSRPERAGLVVRVRSTCVSVFLFFL